MDIAYLKFLLYINKQEKVFKSQLCQKFNISSNDSAKIFSYLKENGYIVYVGSCSCRSTYKGQHILFFILIDWLCKNFLSIIAIIISIIALFA